MLSHAHQQNNKKNIIVSQLAITPQQKIKYLFQRQSQESHLEEVEAYIISRREAIDVYFNIVFERDSRE